MENKEEQKSIILSSLAPNGLDGRAWIKVLKDQLLASKGHEPSDADLLFYAQVCKSSGLDPTKREIYGIYRGGKLTIQTGIDGMRSAAEKGKKFGGSKEPVFNYNEDSPIYVKHHGKDKRVPNSATVTVMKIVGNTVLETTRRANWEDYYPGDGMIGEMYRKFPEVMLAKCAEAQALRAAFPNLGHLYEESEMVQAEVKIVESDKDTKDEALEQAKANLGIGESNE